MRILFVDSEFTIQMLASDALTAAGHEVIAAGGVREAKRLIAERPEFFSCLVTELKMLDELTGTDLILYVRTHYPDIPVVLATGYFQPMAADWLRRMKVNLLEKPYDGVDLVNAVARNQCEEDGVVHIVG